MMRIIFRHEQYHDTDAHHQTQHSQQNTTEKRVSQRKQGQLLEHLVSLDTHETK